MAQGWENDAVAEPNFRKIRVGVSESELAVQYSELEEQQVQRP
jgi:hypothetical protein